MADKVVIKADQIVSRKGGKISYINEQSTLVQANENSVIIQDEAEPQQQPTSDSAPEFPVDIPPTEGEAADQPPPEVPPHVVEATENPKPETDAPPKGGKKDRKMASSAAKKAPAKKAPAKVAAKKAPNKAPKEPGVRTIGGKPVDISEYRKVKSAAGGSSLNNGDAVAEMLEGKDLDACYRIAAQKLKEDEKVLRKKYGSLNTGMQRMNLGNRLRKVLIPKEAKK